MAATRCSGTNAVRYGTMKDNVLAMKVVMANGELMTTARRAKKSSAGYDLTRLMVGSEGTLGVITELTLKLSGIPEAIAGGVCPFPSVEAAATPTILTIQSGIPVARIELLDALQVKAVNALLQARRCRKCRCCSSNSTAATPASPSSRERFGEIVAELGGGPFDWATQAGGPHPALAGAPRRAIVRLAVCGRARRLFATDVCVPISRLAECVTATPARHRRDSSWSRRSSAMSATAISICRCWSTWTMPTRSSAPRISMERLVERALAMDGTCTGEHGVGQGKMKYLLAEHGAPALAAMAAIKRALDPQNIMNPGKIVALDVSAPRVPGHRRHRFAAKDRQKWRTFHHR